jgi:hypothetical protein
MRKTILTIFLLLGCIAASVSAHDLFLKLDSYFLRPNARAVIRVLNGSFRASEGVVRRDRLNDASVVAPGGQVTHPEEGAWRDTGKTTLLDMRTGEAGTYVVGVSTKPREIDLKAKDFNEYLTHDGLPDTLAERRKNNQLGKDVRERYSKHVRAVFQVGDARTNDYKHSLGYPVEIIPQQNPYDLRAGQTLDVLCTLDGKPLAQQFVLSGRERGRKMTREVSARTDQDGIARIRLTSAGKWYVKMIHMSPATEPGLDYESKWATLTFEIKP